MIFVELPEPGTSLAAGAKFGSIESVKAASDLYAPVGGTVAEVNSGITGPNLDQIGPVTPNRVLNAIRIGGTGQGRMPQGLLKGSDAQAVAYYVSHVAGQ